MLLRSLLPSVALALTANAFLVPPHITDKATTRLNEALNNADITTLFPQERVQTVDLACKACSFFLVSNKTGKQTDFHNAETDIELNFVNLNNEIRMNNVKIYPTTLEDISHQPLIGWQKVDKTIAFYPHLSQQWDNRTMATMSYSMDVVSEVPFKDAISTALVIQVLGVNGKVADVEAVAVGVLKKPDGTLILHSVNKISSTMSPAVKQCTTVMCRVKTTIAAKMMAFRATVASKLESLGGGCAKYMGRKGSVGQYSGPGHRGPPVRGGPGKYKGRHPHKGKNDQDRTHPHDHPHHHHHHHHHQHHQHHHSALHKVVHVMHKILRHVVLPVMIGVAAGMAASAVGMLVGQMICMIWMRYRRSRSVGYAPVHQIEIIEEEGRVSGESLPPKYEDLEGQVEVSDEKKDQQ